jgi:hypothetical protein
LAKNQQPKMELLALLKPFPDEALKIWPVDKAVGSVKNTGAAVADAGLGCPETGPRPCYDRCLGGSEKTKMTTDPKRKAHQITGGRDKRRQQEEALDDALKNTFPASDPISVEQPGRDDNSPGLADGE